MRGLLDNPSLLVAQVNLFIVAAVIYVLGPCCTPVFNVNKVAKVRAD